MSIFQNDGVTGLDDATLDGAYAASYDNKDFTAANFYGAEIRDRLISVWSFVSGATGAQRFPKYEARTGFSQQDAAQKSVKTSAGAVLSNIGGVLSGGGFTLAVLALAGVAIYAALR